jgi:hypothetical protein
MLEPPAYNSRVKSQNRADSHKREKPVGVIAKKPLLSLLRRALDRLPLRFETALKTHQGVFEHCAQQSCLWANRGKADARLIELPAEIMWPFMPRVPVAGQGLL